MGQPVVHFEVVGKDGQKLHRYYSELFGWEIDAEQRVPLRHGLAGGQPRDRRQSASAAASARALRATTVT